MNMNSHDYFKSDKSYLTHNLLLLLLFFLGFFFAYILFFSQTTTIRRLDWFIGSGLMFLNVAGIVIMSLLSNFAESNLLVPFHSKFLRSRKMIHLKKNEEAFILFELAHSLSPLVFKKTLSSTPLKFQFIDSVLRIDYHFGSCISNPQVCTAYRPILERNALLIAQLMNVAENLNHIETETGSTAMLYESIIEGLSFIDEQLTLKEEDVRLSTKQVEEGYAAVLSTQILEEINLIEDIDAFTKGRSF